MTPGSSLGEPKGVHLNPRALAAALLCIVSAWHGLAVLREVNLQYIELSLFSVMSGSRNERKLIEWTQ